MFDELIGRIAGCFGRVESRRRAEKLLLGLVSELPRKNCWTIAEYVGDATPDGLQHLLARGVWDAEEVREGLRDYVVEHLGSQDAVLIADETGDLKKGTRTVGVQRQYTGTAGRIGNSQVAVYLTYATRVGHAFIDRALYLPKSWTSDPERCAAPTSWPGGSRNMCGNACRPAPERRATASTTGPWSTSTPAPRWPGIGGC